VLLSALHIFSFVQAKKLEHFDGETRVGEEPEEQQKQEPKTEKLLKALDDEKKRAEEYLTRLKYVQADFENLKKRVDRQLEEVTNYCNERLIIELLDVADELEMAVKSSCSSNSTEALIQGVEMTLKKLKKVLQNEGVSPIECLNKPFDPSKHNAISKVEKEGIEESTVIEEVRKGYVMKGKVIRPSIVKIALKPSSKSQKEANQNE
jgi:molecular chaperone GrpE